MRSAEVQAVINRVGGVSALARRLGVDHSTVSGWTDVPAKHLPAVAAVTGLAMRDIRPDLFRGDQRIGLAENQQGLVAEARSLGLDPDAIAAKALTDAIRAERTRRWQAENREAIEAHNRYVEEHGLPLAKYRMF